MKTLIVQHGIDWENPASNLARLGELTATVPADTDMIILPEMFTTGFTMRASEFAETMDGQTVNWMQSLAVLNNCSVTGSIIISDGGEYFNRLLFVKPDSTVTYYDKAHLFAIGGETSHFSKGVKHLTENFRGVNISFQVCYDLRFPVWSRNRNNSYDLLVNVANWPESRKHVWKTLLIARAIENQCFVIGVNRIGADGAGNFYSGDSMVIGPRGEILASVEPYRQGTISCEISLAELNEFRKSFPVWKDADSFSLDSDPQG